jgi:hypothetical protein
MELNKVTSDVWFVEWLPELSMVQVSVEVIYNPGQCTDSPDEICNHHLMVGRCIKEGMLKEICSDSVKLKMNHNDVVQVPRRFGFYNSSPYANWTVCITAMNRETASTTLTHIDNWESDFYKVFRKEVASE